MIQLHCTTDHFIKNSRLIALYTLQLKVFCETLTNKPNSQKFCASVTMPYSSYYYSHTSSGNWIIGKKNSVQNTFSTTVWACKKWVTKLVGIGIKNV